MTGSPLRKFVVAPAIISAAVFGVLTLPLVILGQKPITIQLQEESLFHGQLRDVAPPYLGLTTVLSLAAGTASLAITGWRHSSQKSAQAEAKLSSLTQNLKEKEELLESLKVSEPRLTASGLTSFLDEDVKAELASPWDQDVKLEPLQSLDREVKLEPATQAPYTNSAEPPTVQPMVMTASVVETQPATPTQQKGQTAATKFASAQTYMGYASRKTVVEPPTSVTSLPSSEVEKVQNQLEQIKAQMEALHQALAAQDQQADASEHSTQLKVIKNWSVEAEKIFS
ncbi:MULTISPECIES: hypothetical protein [unclassified Coleofasciculus]|uniref:hypothetical protein n=1 Tax=unclassified Coleofasciculus TaxID=2692782 RepID=UPI00187ED509|nr:MULTISPECIES: hypothetical protein [unclassified Coleofasciculus]MBE9126832.1 hypothetical protein [Coleofasciculus sp. LEGE 07081]MBE9148958.1 hypothetical protein [Coleofasciculus sp. LEGE 07092]